MAKKVNMVTALTTDAERPATKANSQSKKMMTMMDERVRVKDSYRMM